MTQESPMTTPTPAVEDLDRLESAATEAEGCVNFGWMTHPKISDFERATALSLISALRASEAENEKLQCALIDENARATAAEAERERLIEIMRAKIRYSPHPWDIARPGDIVGIPDAADAILSGPSRMAASSEGEPVAWMFERFLAPGDAAGTFGIYGKPELVWIKPYAGSGRNVTPLYAHPAMLAARPDAGRGVEPLAWPNDKPPPHWTPDDKYDRHPKAAEDWDWRTDPGGDERFDRMIRRLNFAGDMADPRAPDQMALVLRKDLINIKHRLLRQTALATLYKERSEASTPPVAVPVSEERVEAAARALLTAQRGEAEAKVREAMDLSVWMVAKNDARAALTAALAVPDKGVQGDQGSSGGLGQPGSGSQPGANVGATAALAWEDAPLRQMLWAVTGPGCFPNVFACHLNTIRNGDDARYIWGFSVHKGKPGFRTLGQNKAWADENSLLLFSTVGAAFAHITAYFAGAKDIRP
jgi:hypothetical protein